MLGAAIPALGVVSVAVAALLSAALMLLVIEARGRRRDPVSHRQCVRKGWPGPIEHQFAHVERPRW